MSTKKYYECYSSRIDGVTPMGLTSGVSSNGIGLLTAICEYFCHIFGIENELMTKKIEKSKSRALNRMIKAAMAKGADGIMEIRYEISNHTSVIVYGTAFKRTNNNENA